MQDNLTAKEIEAILPKYEEKIDFYSRIWYKKYLHVNRGCRLFTFDELKQAGWLAAWRSLQLYKHSGKSNMDRWVQISTFDRIKCFCRTQYHEHIVEVRNGRLNFQMRDWEEENLVAEEKDVEHQAEREQLARQISSIALHKLTPDDAAIFQMAFVKGMKARDMAKIKNCSVQNIYGRMDSIRRRVRHFMNLGEKVRASNGHL